MKSPLPSSTPIATASLARRGLLQLLLLGSAGVRAQDMSPMDAEIVIGQSCQLSGPLAALTSEARLGADLYFDHINKQGGVRGRRIKVVALDDGYDPKRAAENTRLLIDREKVLALFQYAGTPPSLAAVPIAEEQGVPLIAPFSGAESLRTPFRRYIFNVRAGYGTELAGMAKHLSVIGMNRVAAVYLDNAFGTEGLDLLRKAVQAHGLQLVAQVGLAMNGSTLAKAVEQVAAQKPQATIVISAGQMSVDFVRAYLDAGHRTSFYMLSVISNSQLEKTLGERAYGVVVSQVLPPPWNHSLAISREFDRMAKARGISEYTFSHMEGFLSAKVLVEALRRAGPKPTRSSLVQAMESLGDLDLGGYRVSLSPNKHSSGDFLDFLMMGKDGRFIR